MRPQHTALLCTLLLGMVVNMVRAAPAGCYDWIVKEKLRGGYMSAADLSDKFPRVRAVGMNCVMPKFAGLQAPPTAANVKLLREWGETCDRLGLRLMPVFNFRGGETEKILSDRREVTPAGDIMPRTPCPLDAEFWTLYILGRAVWLAEHSRELGLTGALLDPEMYGSDHTCYGGPCHCDWCLREFCQAAQRAVPDPLPALTERAAWLQAQGLTERFGQHYVDRVAALSRQVEQRCHAANPDFLLGVLLLDYPLPFMKGLALGMGTATHPVLSFSETTYSSGYTAHVEQQPQTFAAMPAAVLFVPGLWQQQFPAENLAEQYYVCAARSVGYWVYTFESMLEDVSKLPGYQLQEPEERYWEALRLANAELDKLAASGGTYVSSLKIRPFDPPLPVLTAGDIPRPVLVASPDAQPVSQGPVTQPRLRYRNPLFILGKTGEPVVVKIENRQLANYVPGTQWLVVGPDGAELTKGHMKVRESAEVRFTPAQDGAYLFLAESGQNSHVLTVTSGQCHGFLASPQHKLTVNGQFGRMYFHVPVGVSQFGLQVKAEGQAAGRGGKLTVFSPENRATAQLAGDLGTQTELPVAVPAGMAGRVWCLQAEDVTNDLTLYLSGGVAAYLSTDPAKVLTTGP